MALLHSSILVRLIALAAILVTSPPETWPRAAAGTVITVVARDYSFDMPGEFPGGLVSFSFENRGREPHYLRFLRLAPGRRLEDVLEWRASRTPMPTWLTPAAGIGTIGPGVAVSYVARLEPGAYVAICGHPSPDGTPHVDKGMIRPFMVRAAGLTTAPSTNRTLELRDHTFAISPPSTAAAETWHVVNRGSTNHQALLVRLPSGVSADAELEWFRGGSRGKRPGLPIGGVIELTPGSEAWFTAALEPGDYLLLCSIPATNSERHFDRGMSRRFTVSR